MKMKLFNTLETLTLDTNVLLNKLPDDYIKWKMIIFMEKLLMIIHLLE